MMHRKVTKNGTALKTELEHKLGCFNHPPTSQLSLIIRQPLAGESEAEHVLLQRSQLSTFYHILLILVTVTDGRDRAQLQVLHTWHMYMLYSCLPRSDEWTNFLCTLHTCMGSHQYVCECACSGQRTMCRSCCRMGSGPMCGLLCSFFPLGSWPWMPIVSLGDEHAISSK